MKKKALNAARILVMNGADPNLCDNNGNSPLACVCEGRHNRALINFLLSCGANPNLTLKQSGSPLTAAVRFTRGENKDEKFKIVKLLLEHGADPNHFCHTRYYAIVELSRHNYNIPPIVAAIYFNEPNLVELLIEFGADIIKPVRATQYGSYYPLDYAIKQNRTEIISILNKHGAKKSP